MNAETPENEYLKSTALRAVEVDGVWKISPGYAAYAPVPRIYDYWDSPTRRSLEEKLARNDLYLCEDDIVAFSYSIPRKYSFSIVSPPGILFPSGRFRVWEGESESSRILILDGALSYEKLIELGVPGMEAARLLHELRLKL